ncbi:hypothetical protein CKA32_000626 [Geitlerinema sp. FC II]|nr:hypothetical protein CKA32_000626 [Geitlerinema sp. FC II]
MPRAIAQTVNVPFDGTLNSSCTLSVDFWGTLGQLEGDPGVYAYMDSFAGSPGVVVVNCTGDALVSIADPIPMAEPPGMPAGTIYSASVGSVSIGGTPLTPADPPTLVTPALSEFFYVDMSVYSGAPAVSLPDGPYAYEVPLTVTGN